MKKVFIALMAVLVLASCSKSGVKEYQVEEVPFSASHCELEPLKPEKRPELMLASEVFSVVPGTCTIEYYQPEGEDFMYELKLTMKCRVNKPIEFRDYTYGYIEQTYKEDARSMTMPELISEHFFMQLVVTPLNADGKPIDEVGTFSNFGKHVKDNPAECKANNLDGIQEWYDFLTSPAGTEKEMCMYGGAGGQNFISILDDITSFCMYFNLSRFNEGDPCNYWAFK